MPTVEVGENRWTEKSIGAGVGRAQRGPKPSASVIAEPEDPALIPELSRDTDVWVMDSVLEKLQPKAVKAQGNSIGPVEAKTGKRNLQFAVWTPVQYFNKIISKTRHIGRVECGN